MSYTCITTFITITEGINVTRYQNSNTTAGGASGKIRLNGRDHTYLSFIYQGAAKNRSGDNIESALVLSANQISMSKIRAAVANKAQVEVSTCVMQPDFSAPTGAPLATENWLATSMSYDTETIEVLLSSAIDAVGAITPNRVLTRAQVGDLPVSGSITNR